MSEAASITAVGTSAEPSSKLRSFGLFMGYGLFFLAALLVSLVLTFPNRQLKGFVESQARKAGYPMVIENMALTGLGGVELEGIKLTVPQPKGKDGKPKPGDATVVRLDKVAASVALWPLIRRYEVDAKFSLQVGDGTIEAGHIVARQGVAIAGASPRGRKNSRKAKRGNKGKRGNTGNKGKGDADDKSAAKSSGKKTWLVDLEIPSIDNLDLVKMGVASRMLGFTDKIGGDLQGSLSGAVSLHWEGTHEGAKGDIDIELTDAVLHNPTVAIDPKGPPLALQNLRLGVVTIKVRIDEKGRINLLKSKRGVDSSTALHLAGVDIFGPDLELVAEERGHVIIPPGRRGMQQARMQVHLVFALPKPQPNAKKRGGKKGATEQGGDRGRASWNMVREMMNGKFKRFMRSGYLGITCSGALSRPVCAPSLPQVTVGTRKRARSEARAKAKKGGSAKKKRDLAAKKAELAQAAAKKKAEEARKKAEEAKKKQADKTVDGKKVKFAPAVRPGAKTAPTPRTDGEQRGGVKVDQANKKKKLDEEGDDEDDEEGDDEGGEEGGEEDEEGGKKKAAKKKADDERKKKGEDDEDLEEEDEE